MEAGSGARRSAEADGGPPAGSRRRRRLWLIWIPILAFLAGVGLTAAVVAGLAGLEDDAPGGDPLPSGAAESPAQEAAAGSQGDVPQACVEAAEYNEILTLALEEIALGVRDQDAAALTTALDAVQDAQPGSESASKECLDLAGHGSDGTDEEAAEEPADPSPEPSESTGPTSTPTP